MSAADAPVDDQVPSLPTERSATHFMHRLGVRSGVTADGRPTAALRHSHDHPPDTGLLVLLADMVGGHAALVAGRPCGLSTTPAPTGRPVAHARFGVRTRA